MKSLKLTMVATAMLLSTQAFAQTTYPGLNYPQPDVGSRGQINQEVEMKDILSGGIASSAIEDSIPQLKRQALEEVATALGASAGLSNRMKERRMEIEANSASLDAVFDFKKLTIDNGVLAPVLAEGISNYAQDSDDEIRVSDKIYKIEKPARFVSVYPTWRDYLVFAFPSYEKPNTAYLPVTSAEKKVWDEAVKKGWAKGRRQADSIVESSYNRLDRDYNGMILYKLLLAEGLITPTVIAKQNLGVTGGGREMAVNDQVFRITDHSSLNPNSKDWKVEYPVTNNVNGQLK